MKTVRIKIFWNYEKEEKYLNDMCTKGLALTDYCWIRYVFQDCEPGEYIYRIELLKNKASDPASRKYIEFMEETGAEHVSSYLYWVYFRKRAEEGPFEIYSDKDSKIRHYKRIIRLFGFFGAMNLFIWLFNFTIGLYNLLEYHSMLWMSNLWMSSLNLVIACILGVVCIKFIKKVNILKRETIIRQ